MLKLLLNRYTGFTAAVCMSTCLFLSGACQTAYANSAPLIPSEAQYGAVPVGAERLCVEKEILDFDIPVLSQQDIVYPGKSLTLDDAVQGCGTVTAEYYFYNPTDRKISACMAFAMGEYQNNRDHRILVDKTETASRSRYSCYQEGSFYGPDDALKLRDDYIYDVFFKPDMPVCKYTYTVSVAGDEGVYAVFSSEIKDKEVSRPLIDISGCDKGQYYTKVWDGDSIVSYVFGGNGADGIGWSIEDRSGKELSLPVSKTERMTFEEFAGSITGYPDDIRAEDKYNIIVEGLNKGYSGGVYTGPCVYPAALWYEYEFSMKPGERKVNSVTAALAPDMDRKNRVDYYTYTYYLSPAQSFSEFGPVDIYINTPYHLADGGGYDFAGTKDGYELHLDMLPSGELTFVLTEEDAKAGSNTAGSSTGGSGAGAGEKAGGIAGFLKNIFKLILCAAIGVGAMALLIFLIAVKPGKKKGQ